jgi:hypothetical protein
MDVLLPQTAIDILPFSAEPFSQWRVKADIGRFIYALYANSSYPPFSRYLYKEGKKNIKMWSKEFARCAEKTNTKTSNAAEDIHIALVKSLQKEEDVNVGKDDSLRPPQNILDTDVNERASDIPSFFDDQEFGRAAKYVVAWKCSVQNLLEEAGFYSLAHILESEAEINSSLLLASHVYYKQAVQVLRSFLEELVMPIHFCENVQEFNLWKANSYRTPPLRGRDGLIKKLSQKGILPTSLATEVADLYGDLNSYIHGSENRLNYKNIHISTATDLIFDYRDFCKWAGYLCRSIDIGIRLLRVNYLQWDAILFKKLEILKQEGKIMCTSCHNETDFDVMSLTTEMADFEIPLPDGTWAKADESFPGFIMYTCRQCGHLTVVEAEK